MKIFHLEAEHPEIKIGFQVERIDKDYEILSKILIHCISDCWCKEIIFEPEYFRDLHEEVAKKLKLRITRAMELSILDTEESIEISLSKIT